MTKPVDPGPLRIIGKVIGVHPNNIGASIIVSETDLIAESIPGNPNWQGHAAWLVCASNNHEALVNALKDVFALMDEGFLVRNTENDSNPDWAIEQLLLVKRLGDAHAILKGIGETK